MTADRRNWLAYLPDRALWTPALVEVLERGHYIRWNHNNDWLVLLSVKDGDVAPVQDGGGFKRGWPSTATPGMSFTRLPVSGLANGKPKSMANQTNTGITRHADG